MQQTALTLAIMLVAGVAAAGTPFRGDQALFTLYAEQCHNGKVLYRDLWDVTNPGVYWFYELAGSLFGFTEDGIHLGEWLWFTAFVVTLTRLTGSIAPALLVGAWYYFTSCADPSHLTKVEGLVAFPLFLAVLFACRGWLFAAGVAGGVVLLFKFAFGLCLLAAWLPTVIAFRRQPLTLLKLPAGIMVILGLAAAYFAAHNAFGIVVETLFVTPRAILAMTKPADFARLELSLRWFVETSVPLMVIAFAGSLLMSRDRLVISYLLMLPAALIVILIQRWSWWSYHFLLLSLPLAVLASWTWPALKARYVDPLSRRERSAVYGLGLILFLSPLAHGGMAYLRLLSFSRSTARNEAGSAYRIATTETAWLADAPPGPIFVAGDPLFHYLSHRPLATRTHGWVLELFTPQLWFQLHEELIQTKPKFIYVSKLDGYHTLIAANPVVQNHLTKDYRIVRDSANGTWYEYHGK